MQKGAVDIAKRTVENCGIAKRGVKLGEGEPHLDGDGKCMGYSHANDDEPIEECKKCKLNNWHVEDDHVILQLGEVARGGFFVRFPLVEKEETN